MDYNENDYLDLDRDDDYDDESGEYHGEDSISLYDSHSCALQEISGLSSYNRNPKAAMKAFCKMVFKRRNRYYGQRADDNHLYCFYLFTSSVYPRVKSTYGSQFAKFIRENNLGTLIESPIVKNVAFHDDHSNQVWVWSPDENALREWWSKNGKGK